MKDLGHFVNYEDFRYYLLELQYPNAERNITETVVLRHSSCSFFKEFKNST